MKTFYLVLALSMTAALWCRADVITLTPTADGYVDALTPDVAYGSDVLRATMTGVVDEPATALSFFYVQYQMPEGMTGQDVASINSINLSLRRAPGASTLSLTYYVYAVFEGFDSESADAYTWNDGVGFDPANTLVKFLNPENEEIFYYSDPAESGFVGFIDTASEGPPTRPFSFFTTQSAFATQNLHDLLTDDTDGRLTFYVKVRQNYAVTNLQNFASMETATIAPPTLTLDVNIGARPVDGDYNNDGTVDGLDLTVWSESFGEAGESLAADGDEDGDVDGNDFLIWQQNFGSGAASPAVAAVPEPTGVVLLATAIGALAYRRRSQPASRN